MQNSSRKESFFILWKLKCLIYVICNIGKHKLHETQDIDSLSREIKHTLLKTIKSPEYSANSKDAVSHLENEKIKVKGLESEALFGKFVQVDLDRIKTAINHLKYLIHFYVHVAVVS